jgi:hypothetical protein
MHFYINSKIIFKICGAISKYNLLILPSINVTICRRVFDESRGEVIMAFVTEV